jgi:hypothetical protein
MNEDERPMKEVAVVHGLYVASGDSTIESQGLQAMSNKDWSLVIEANQNNSMYHRLLTSLLSELVNRS